jgi:hypothetical protein
MIQTGLSLCCGYRVHADDGELGVVETPLFPPDGSEPDFLVLRIADGAGARRPVVAAALVEAVDAERRVVRVHGLRADLALLPEHLPLAT